MALKDILRSVAGTFVEIEGPSDAGLKEDDWDRQIAEINAKTGVPAATVEDAIRHAPGPNLEDIQVPDGTVLTDFPSVYQAAGVPPSPFTAEQALDLVNNLPATLPTDLKRQTVKTSLSAIGATVGATSETVVQDATMKLAAITSYAEKATLGKNAFVERTQAEIADLTAQIEAKKQTMMDMESHYAKDMAACNEQGARLKSVVDFFALPADPAPAPQAEPGGASQ